MAGTRHVHGMVGVLFWALWWAPMARGQAFGGGTGEPNDPYLICTPEQMNEIGLYPDLWHRHFKLMVDIDLSQYKNDSFNLIGRLEGLPFSGVFDGNGHTISGFTYVSADRLHVGLFEWIHGYSLGRTAVVKNLGLIDPNIDASMGLGVGSFASRVDRGIIANCYVRGGRVKGNRIVGGLLGANVFSGRVMNCYASTMVVGDSVAGGLVGDNYKSTVSLCYSTSTVVGNEQTGGLLGDNSGKVVQSFWDIEASGQLTSAGGVGKTTVEMQKASMFLGWTCGDQEIWTIDEGRDYPRLWWEHQPGQVIEPRRLAELLPGSGTSEDPFLIRTAQELWMIGLFSCDWDKSFRLVADIDLGVYEGTDWNPIGYHRNDLDNRPFTGTFDGDGHVISNFRYTWPGGYVGLFAQIDDPNARITNLGLVGPVVEEPNANDVGALVGCLAQGVIAECYVQNGRVSGASRVGGLVGTNVAGTIEHCHASVAVESRTDAGGLAGCNEGTVSGCHTTGTVAADESVGGLIATNRGTVMDCCSTADVSGDWWVGGLLGDNSATVARCYSAGSVSGQIRVGGLAGGNIGAITDCYSTATVSGDAVVGGLLGASGGRFAVPVIANCFAAGRVTSNKTVGGLVGDNSEPVLGSYWDTQTSDQAISAGGTGKTTTQMQTAATYVEAGWDFDTVWTICEGKDYPHLRWENVKCDE